MIEFFGTLGGRFAVGASIIAAIVAGWFTWLWQHDNRVIASHDLKIEKKAMALNDKGLKARAAVSGIDDPAGRLLGKYCRDC